MTEQEKREKVIKALEYCSASCKGAWDEKNGCPYMAEWIHMTMHDKRINGRCVDLLAKDALELLKAQEPVEPTLDVRHGKSMWRCGSCSTALQPNQMHAKFCFNCGRAVKWDG